MKYKCLKVENIIFKGLVIYKWQSLAGLIWVEKGSSRRREINRLGHFKIKCNEQEWPGCRL